ncbi:DUF6588 family protein [Labilibacter marinus]|uniref:DUF6588 family protein n=1 Tax=Labilibacter marinus TaxID=1477105 RepID=UPI00082DED1E|nr:DUF6588 family protein [Labilibacter marinus]
MRKNLFVAFLLLLCPFIGQAQSLEDYLSKYTADNGEKYLQPFANAFASDLNSGLFHNAEIKKNGFQLYIGVVSQVAMISSDAKFFTATIDDPAFGPTQTVPNAPTVFGPTEGPKIENESGQAMYLPGGFDIDYMPLAMPQITIGSLYGTDFTARFFKTGVEDIGDIDLFGWGIRHSVDQYISKLPFKMAVGYYHQKFSVGDYMDTKTNVVNLQASFAVPVVTFYGGLAYESDKVNITYTYEGLSASKDAPEPGDQIAFEMETEGSMRATIGLCINMGPVKLHGDYNMAKQNTFAVGLGIGINQK